MTTLSSQDLAGLSDDQLKALLDAYDAEDREERRECQLLDYVPSTPRALRIHTSLAKVLEITGGNRSSKTDSSLAELAMCATGIIPDSLKDVFPREKLRGPVALRVVCESLITTMDEVILKKLQWWQWSGVDQSGGKRGHWGWIPRDCLIDGEWNKSWSAKRRTLKMYYRNPDNPTKIEGISTLNIMSFDQHPSDFESGEFHHIHIDEPCPHAIFRACRARVMSVAGRLLLSFTWPDDPSIPVDWIFDEIHEKATEGAKRDPAYEWINLVTTENPHIDQEAVKEAARGMTELERLTRIEGRPIRFSSRIHPLFTDTPSTWCFGCGGETFLNTDGACSACGSTDVTEFCHVGDVPANPLWPGFYLLDPHPRKPHMMLWGQVDGNDDVYILREAQVDGDAVAVKNLCDDTESELSLSIAVRKMDPNMGRSPSGAKRELTWQEEFENAGLYCDLADDSDVGRKRLNEWFKPDPRTRRTRIMFDRSCYWTCYQHKRYCWDDKGKQRPKPEHDDFPTLLKYWANAGLTFGDLKGGGTPLRLVGERRGAYG